MVVDEYRAIDVRLHPLIIPRVHALSRSIAIDNTNLIIEVIRVCFSSQSQLTKLVTAAADGFIIF
jgi:hypothetical protein